MDTLFSTSNFEFQLKFGVLASRVGTPTSICGKQKSCVSTHIRKDLSMSGLQIITIQRKFAVAFLSDSVRYCVISRQNNHKHNYQFNEHRETQLSHSPLLSSFLSWISVRSSIINCMLLKTMRMYNISCKKLLLLYIYVDTVPGLMLLAVRDLFKTYFPARHDTLTRQDHLYFGMPHPSASLNRALKFRKDS